MRANFHAHQAAQLSAINQLAQRLLCVRLPFAK